MIELFVEIGALVFLYIIWRQVSELETKVRKLDKKLEKVDDNKKIERIRNILEADEDE